MHRKRDTYVSGKSNQYKNEISIDEPLNVDWDGNELLLSDILGTDDDTVNKGIESEVEKQLLLEEIEKLCPREKQIMKNAIQAFRPKRNDPSRSLMKSVYPNPTYQDLKSG